jgi:hypothetical protein
MSIAIGKSWKKIWLWTGQLETGAQNGSGQTVQGEEKSFEEGVQGECFVVHGFGKSVKTSSFVGSESLHRVLQNGDHIECRRTLGVTSQLMFSSRDIKSLRLF